MPSYVQKKTYNEDGYGLTTLTMVIADSHDDLFTPGAIGEPEFTGTGLNDMTSGGTLTAYAAATYKIVIQTSGAPDTFDWYKDTILQGNDIAITGSAQTLDNGVTITFAATTGHTISDYWEFSTGEYITILSEPEHTEKLELKTGQLTEDNVTFEINEAAITAGTIDELAKDFILDAQDKTVKRYIGIFEDDPADVPSSSNKVFTGAIMPSMDAQILNYTVKTEYATTRTPVYKWKIDSQPLVENLFDDIELSEIVDEIDSTWETANVSERAGHYYYSSGGSTYESKFYNLVNLNKLLKKMTSIAETLLVTKGLGTYTIDFDATSVDGKFRPTRFTHPSVDGFVYHWSSWVSYSGTSTPYPSKIYPNDDTDAKSLKLGRYDDSGGDITDDVSPFIHYGVIKAATYEIDNEEAADYLWTENDKLKTFSDLLYRIALEFGTYLRMSESGGTITIRFEPRYNFVSTQIYVKDAKEDSIKTAPITESGSQYFGYSFWLAWEGNRSYKYDHNAKTYHNKGYPEITNRERMLFTLSPTCCWVFNEPSVPAQVASFYFPHNSILYVDSTAFTQPRNTVRGITTAIYMKVDPYGSDDGEPTSAYWTPAGRWSIDNGSEEISYETMSEYLNYLYIQDKSYYETEKDITCPYINGFSVNSNGSSNKWNAVGIGSQITYEGINYTVVEIKRTFGKRETKLKLHNVSRFAYSTPTISTTVSDGPTDSYSVGEPEGYADIETGTASGSISKYCFLAKTSDGYYEMATPLEAHYGKICAFALEDASDTETFYLARPGGSIDMDGISALTPGNHIYLRDDTPYNWSENYIEDKSATEELFLNCGLVEGAYRFWFEIENEFIFE